MFALKAAGKLLAKGRPSSARHKASCEGRTSAKAMVHFVQVGLVRGCPVGARPERAHFGAAGRCFAHFEWASLLAACVEIGPAGAFACAGKVCWHFCQLMFGHLERAPRARSFSGHLARLPKLGIALTGLQMMAHCLSPDPDPRT